MCDNYVYTCESVTVCMSVWECVRLCVWKDVWKCVCVRKSVCEEYMRLWWNMCEESVRENVCVCERECGRQCFCDCVRVTMCVMVIFIVITGKFVAVFCLPPKHISSCEWWINSRRGRNIFHSKRSWGFLVPSLWGPACLSMKSCFYISVLSFVPPVQDFLLLSPAYLPLVQSQFPWESLGKWKPRTHRLK